MSVRNNVIPCEPLTTCQGKRDSRFCYGDLWMLDDPKHAYRSPLSVIALVDMNAFFAQVEQVRLGLTTEDPVVCVQWNSLIAVSYAARKFGIGRMDNIQTAKQKCPGVILAHAAVFRKGNAYWAYYDGLPHQSNCKVSLDPYRREGRKIVKLFSKHCDVVEKSSVDESYLDLGRLVYNRMVHHFPQLARSEDKDRAMFLPPIPTVLPHELQWQGEVVSTDTEENENEKFTLLSESQKGAGPTLSITDWDDVCMVVGSQVLYDLRKMIYDELGYTTSGGLANNKLVAKLAAGFKKPDFQTIIRNRSANAFLSNFKLNDISGMGGKLGENVNERLNLPSENQIAYIRDNFTLEDLKQEFKEDVPFALKLYEMVRGCHKKELTKRMEIKSMMSTKNFTGKSPVKTLGDANDWINVYAGDLYNRMIELDDESMNLSMVDPTKRMVTMVRRPKTLSVHVTTMTYSTRSRQTQIPICPSLDKLRDVLKTYATKTLIEVLSSVCDLSLLNGNRPLADILQETNLNKIKICELARMGITISNFVKSNGSDFIGTFTGKSHNPKEEISKEFSKSNVMEQEPQQDSNSSKRQKMDKEYISKLFADYEMKEKSFISTAKQNTASSRSSADKKYIKKLFEDYRKVEDELNVTSKQQNSDTLPDSKIQDGPTKGFIKEPSSSDKEYQRELFSKFESESKLDRTIAKLNVQKPKKSTSTKVDIVKSLKTKSKSPDIASMNSFCPKCKEIIYDEAEHNDLHYALELSAKLNS